MTEIQDADALAETSAHETALACIEAGIDAAHPEQVVYDSVSLDGDTLTIRDETYDLADYDRVLVVGGGKAGGGVTAALEAVLGDRITDGVVVTRDPEETEFVDVVVGDHPVPSQEGVDGARRILDLLTDADERTLVLGVITGGASALLAAPVESISLADLQTTTTELLESGAEIDEINAVRKHLSAVKGGQLARAASPATVAGLVLSDVVGNDLSVIASGPTAPDDSTFADALDVLERYGIDAPQSVRERLEAGVAGDVAETPRADDPAFERVTNHVLADGFTALEAARSVARERGYDSCILSSRIRGEAREAAKSHVAIGEEVTATGNPVDAPAVILAGGETTVTVRGDGRGGPNQEFALAAALELRGRASTVVGAVDTDGRDGGVDVAGALVDGETVSDVAAAREALADNDAFPYLDEQDAIVRTGPTGTNVNDLRVLVVEGED
jgi:glycerate 2-kinase